MNFLLELLVLAVNFETQGRFGEVFLLLQIMLFHGQLQNIRLLPTSFERSREQYEAKLEFPEGNQTAQPHGDCAGTTHCQ